MMSDGCLPFESLSGSELKKSNWRRAGFGVACLGLMSTRSKRKRKVVSYTYDEEEEVEEEAPLPEAHLHFELEMPTREPGQGSILQRLDANLFQYLVSFLRAQDLHAVRQVRRVASCSSL